MGSTEDVRALGLAAFAQRPSNIMRGTHGVPGGGPFDASPEDLHYWEAFCEANGLVKGTTEAVLSTDLTHRLTG